MTVYPCTDAIDAAGEGAAIIDGFGRQRECNFVRVMVTVFRVARLSRYRRRIHDQQVRKGGDRGPSLRLLIPLRE